MGKTLFHMAKGERIDINVLQKKQFHSLNSLLEEIPGGKNNT